MTIFEDTKTAFKGLSNYELKRAHFLFEAVNLSFLVNIAEKTLPVVKNIPGVKTLIKNTIYSHFCGGETREKSLKTVHKLHEQNVYSILDYSVEGKEEEKAYDNCLKEILAVIALAEKDAGIPFVVFKPTGYGNIKLYEKVGKNKTLNSEEQAAWERIKKRFQVTAEKAFEANVLLLVDAEETWMQNAADDLVLDLMRQFNKEKCVVFNTLQMYRKDRLAYLKYLKEIAEKENFYLGFKIVRGAYMEKERERALEEGYPSPIQDDKQSTDNDYNAAIDFIIDNRSRIHLFAGTHNELSCKLLMDKLKKENIDKETPSIWFGQLLGMSDNISFVLSDLGYNVAKYVPYGPVKEVIPYLIRRAQENTSVAGQSGRELVLIEKELKRRKLSKN